MTFAQWVKAQGRGEMKRLERKLGIGYMTLIRLNQGHAVRGRIAKLVSEETGGKVSIEELVCPAPQPAPAHAPAKRKRGNGSAEARR